MKRKTLVISAAAATLALGVAAYTASPGFAHGNSGWGYKGHGYSHGGHHGYMGHGKGDCGNYGHRMLDKDLTVEDVQKLAEHKLSRFGNDRLKVGKVEAVDDNTIVAEIVTIDNSLVWKFQFDTKTGAHRPIN